MRALGVGFVLFLIFEFESVLSQNDNSRYEETISEMFDEMRRKLGNLESNITSNMKIFLDEILNRIKIIEEHNKPMQISREDNRMRVRIAQIYKMVHEISSNLRQVKGNTTLKNSIREIFDEETKSNFHSKLTKRDGKTNNKQPKNCKEIIDSGNNISGIYKIYPENSPPFFVLCEMQAFGGGWTFIHNRFEGVQEFNLDWNDYKEGFGNLAGEFWLGLEKIHTLTNQRLNELLVEMGDFESNQTVYAHYSIFIVGSEEEGYRISAISGFGGDAGDSLYGNGGCKFSTRDKDQDSWSAGNCADSHGGGWWFKSCTKSNLNGRYLGGRIPMEQINRGMYWDSYKGPLHSLAKARLLIRPT